METESAAAPPMVHSSAGEGNPHTRTAHTNRLIFSLLYINGYVTAREPRRSYTQVGSSQGDGPTTVRPSHHHHDAAETALGPYICTWEPPHRPARPVLRRAGP